MDLSYIFKIVCLILLFSFWIILAILIGHDVPFSTFIIIYGVGLVLIFISFSLSLFFEYGGSLYGFT